MHPAQFAVAPPKREIYLVKAVAFGALGARRRGGKGVAVRLRDQRANARPRRRLVVSPADDLAHPRRPVQVEFAVVAISDFEQPEPRDLHRLARALLAEPRCFERAPGLGHVGDRAGRTQRAPCRAGAVERGLPAHIDPAQLAVTPHDRVLDLVQAITVGLLGAQHGRHVGVAVRRRDQRAIARPRSGLVGAPADDLAHARRPIQVQRTVVAVVDVEQPEPRNLHRLALALFAESQCVQRAAGLGDVARDAEGAGDAAFAVAQRPLDRLEDAVADHFVAGDQAPAAHGFEIGFRQV